LSPWAGGGEHGGQGQGSLLPSLTAGPGRPWAHRVTPAKGEERAQVVPWLEAVKGHTGQRGRPRTRRKGIATEKG
jgi:hypothetical protein